MTKFEVGDHVYYIHGDFDPIPQYTRGIVKEIEGGLMGGIGVTFDPPVKCTHERGYWIVTSSELRKVAYSPAALTNIVGAH